MNEQPVSLQALLPVLLEEGRRRRVALGLIFAAITLAAMVVGVLWPKKYEASTTILVQESNIIAPLMKGAATPTANTNRADIARAVILSREVLDKVLAAGGWLDGHPSPVELDRITNGIKARTVVKFSRDNLLTISYYDSDPVRTYKVTRLFGQLFISESLASKQRESRDAFDFINGQVEAYKRKLTSAEDKLKAYVTITLDNCFVIRDLKVIHGNTGLFIAMPAKRRKDGTYKDIAHPLNADTRERMERTILLEYERQAQHPHPSLMLNGGMEVHEHE